MNKKKFVTYFIIFILGLLSYLFLSIKFIIIFFIESLILFLMIVFILFFKFNLKKNNKFSKWWFILIEIVVSITIILLLSTGAYLVIWNFLKWNNDQIRKSHLNQIVLSLKNIDWKYPLPDNYTSLYFSWKIIWFQWVFCETNFAKLDLPANIKDPETWKCYNYLVNSNQDKYQLYTYLISENKNYFLWNELWIVMSWSQAIDSNFTWNLELLNNINYNIYKNDNEFFTDFKYFIKNCSDIQKYWIWKESWIYTVYSWTTEKKMYCDMETKKWWWTIVVNVIDTDSAWSWDWIDNLWTYTTWQNWIFSRTGINNLFTDNLQNHQALIKYSDGNYTILDYYSWNIQAFYDWKYAVQISTDNCVANNWRCWTTTWTNISWGYFCNNKDPFFEDYTFWTWWAWNTPDKSSYDCVNKTPSFVGIK